MSPYSASISACGEFDRSSSRSAATPCAANNSRNRSYVAVSLKACALSNRRLRGTPFIIVAHSPITESLSFANLLKVPKVTQPAARAGSIATSGAYDGGASTAARRAGVTRFR